MTNFVLAARDRNALRYASERLLASEDPEDPAVWNLFQRCVDEMRAQVLYDLADANNFPAEIDAIIRARARGIRTKHVPHLRRHADGLSWVSDDAILAEGTRRLRVAHPEVWRAWTENGLLAYTERLVSEGSAVEKDAAHE